MEVGCGISVLIYFQTQTENMMLRLYFTNSLIYISSHKIIES